MDTPKKKPKTVNVIGWTFTIFAVLLVLSGTMGLWLSYLFNKMPSLYEEVLLELPVMLKSNVHLIESIELFAILQIVFGIFILLISIYFLKLYYWARIALEIVCWVGLVFTIIFCVLAVFISFGARTLIADRPLPSIDATYLLIVVNVVISLLFIIPVIILIRILRSKIIKDAFIHKDKPKQER